MKIAYCRECKTVIATGNLAPQQVFVKKGRRNVVNTMPHHTVDGKEHRDVGLLDVPDEAPGPSGIDKFFKDLAKKHKAEFK